MRTRAPRPWVRELPVRLVPTPAEAPALSVSGTCVHAPVCALKRGLEGLNRLAVPLPMLGEGLAVRMAAAVDCTYYLRAKGAKPVRRVPAAVVNPGAPAPPKPRPAPDPDYKLNDMQRKAVDAIVVAGDIKEAARRAGLSESQIRMTLWQLANHGRLPQVAHEAVRKGVPGAARFLG